MIPTLEKIAHLLATGGCTESAAAEWMRQHIANAECAGIATMREILDTMKAAHSNMVAINRALRDRPDLQDRAKGVQELAQRLAVAEAEVDAAWEALGGRESNWIEHVDMDGTLRREPLTLEAAILFTKEDADAWHKWVSLQSGSVQDLVKDARRFQKLQNMPALKAQSFFWHHKSRKERAKAIDEYTGED